MIEIYVIVTHKTSWEKNFEIFKIKNRGKKMFKKFPTFFWKLCFRDTALVFFYKKILLLSTSTYSLPKFFIGVLHGLKKQNLAQAAMRVLRVAYHIISRPGKSQIEINCIYGF